MILQYHEKVASSLKLKLLKLQKYKDLLGYPTKIKDACRGRGVGGPERGRGIHQHTEPCSPGGIFGRWLVRALPERDDGNHVVCKVLLSLTESVRQFPRNNHFGDKRGRGLNINFLRVFFPLTYAALPSPALRDPARFQGGQPAHLPATAASPLPPLAPGQAEQQAGQEGAAASALPGHRRDTGMRGSSRRPRSRSRSRSRSRPEGGAGGGAARAAPAPAPIGARRIPVSARGALSRCWGRRRHIVALFWFGAQRARGEGAGSGARPQRRLRLSGSGAATATARTPSHTPTPPRPPPRQHGPPCPPSSYSSFLLRLLPPRSGTAAAGGCGAGRVGGVPPAGRRRRRRWWQ